MANTMRHINIIGHQNPDTDSICSALAYAWLKNRGSLTGLYEARRAGHVNRETKFVLQHFGVEPPRLCTDVSPQIKDIDIRKQAGIDGEMSLRAAWNLMRDVEIDTLCIVDDENELQGLITIKDIADANMDLFDTAVSNRSMFASAMSLMVIRPCSSFSSSTMQSVSISTSRIRFQAARRLISPSMPACLRMSISLICGLTSVHRRGGSTPKCCKTNFVSRLTCPARRASYRPVRLPRFFSHA